MACIWECVWPCIPAGPSGPVCWLLCMSQALCQWAWYSSCCPAAHAALPDCRCLRTPHRCLKRLSWDQYHHIGDVTSLRIGCDLEEVCVAVASWVPGISLLVGSMTDQETGSAWLQSIMLWPVNLTIVCEAIPNSLVYALNPCPYLSPVEALLLCLSVSSCGPLVIAPCGCCQSRTPVTLTIKKPN